jgi:hypothetical protein
MAVYENFISMLRKEINNKQGKVMFTTSFLISSIVFSERKFLVLITCPKNISRSTGIICGRTCRMLCIAPSSFLGNSDNIIRYVGLGSL